MIKHDPILEIKNLVVKVDNTIILNGLSLTIFRGEVHALMGPNGSGKSTLAYVLAKHPDYHIVSGSVYYLGKDIKTLTPEELAWNGVFLGFQYPVSIPGVSNIQFLKTALNALRVKQNKPLLDAVDFLNLIKEKVASFSMREELLYRSINEGFSGGEKKRNEILQMSLFEPTLAILDEIDSGLDIDALKMVSESIQKLRSKERSILLITHYQRLLDYVEPDFVHVVRQGNIICSGDKTLALELEEKGYS